MKYPIQSDVKMPAGRSNGLRSVIRELAMSNVGNSVFIPKSDYYPDTIRRTIQTFGAAWAATRSSVENNKEGTRVWKIAEPSVAIQQQSRRPK